MNTASLKLHLDGFLERWDARPRVSSDPVELVHRYKNPRDIEVSALLASSLAYGRVELFKPKVASLLDAMGPSPASYVKALDVKGAALLLGNFVYRFNVGTDIAVLLLGAGQAMRNHGSLESAFAHCLSGESDLRAGLGKFIALLRDVPMAPLRRAMGRERGLHHLLPMPLGLGAAKRLNLFLRWMVRGPDGIDFGIWKSIPRARLVIPLDTHIHRMALRLNLTRRKSMGWRTAEEITASLRRLDPADPVKYDFALCHYGMSGACPAKSQRSICQRCPLVRACRVGVRFKRA